MEALHKITVNIFEDDYQSLREFYKNTGYQRALRLLIRKHTRELQRRKDKQKQGRKGIGELKGLA